MCNIPTCDTSRQIRHKTLTENTIPYSLRAQQFLLGL